jgi:membrane protease YdiL (CAAX protease family)
VCFEKSFDFEGIIINMKILKKITNKVLYLCLFMILSIIIQIPTISEGFFWGESSKNINLFLHVAITFFSTIIIFLIVYTVYHRLNSKPIFVKNNIIRSYSFAVLFALLSQILQFAITVLEKGNDRDLELLAASQSKLAPILIITLVLISPLLEAMVWQGILQGGILKDIPPLFSIIITSVLFAFAHGYSFNYKTLELLCSGISYAVLYYVTDDLGSVVFCHGLSNLIVYLINFVF